MNEKQWVGTGTFVPLVYNEPSTPSYIPALEKYTLQREGHQCVHPLGGEAP